ncbi:MAG: hypothetical protein K6E14_02935 [Paludibacteraceae bacterium]|nr:hypothetical protein [Paludibacteraceae bacterium]
MIFLKTRQFFVKITTLPISSFNTRNIFHYI